MLHKWIHDRIQCSYAIKAIHLCALIFASVCVYLCAVSCIVSFYLISIWCIQSVLLMFLFNFVWYYWLINDGHLYEIFHYSVEKSNRNCSSSFVIYVVYVSTMLYYNSLFANYFVPYQRCSCKRFELLTTSKE